jgi:hypothetical protein
VGRTAKTDPARGQEIRRRLRRQMGIPPCDMTSRVLAWGMGVYSWRRPWASIPKQRLMIQASHLHWVVLINEHRTSQVCIILLNTGICNCAGYDAPLPVLPVPAVPPPPNHHEVRTPNMGWFSCHHRKRRHRASAVLNLHTWCVDDTNHNNLFHPSMQCPQGVNLFGLNYKLAQCTLQPGGNNL